MSENLKTILTDHTFIIVACSCGILGIICGIAGSFAVLRKESLIGDALSHASLPGIAIAFMITSVKNNQILLLGAVMSSILAIFCINLIIKNSRIKFDASITLVMSVFFGLGLTLISYIQKTPNSNQAGLKNFIFGQASTLVLKDLKLLILALIIVLFIIIIFWKELKIVTFDRNFAKTLGINLKLIDSLMYFIMVFVIVSGLQAVGAILITALLISPGVAAKQFTNKLWLMVLIASLIGGVSGVLATFFSMTIDDLPTGPTIVVIVTIIAVFSLFFAPKNGIFYKTIKRKLF